MADSDGVECDQEKIVCWPTRSSNPSPDGRGWREAPCEGTAGFIENEVINSTFHTVVNGNTKGEQSEAKHLPIRAFAGAAGLRSSFFSRP